MSYTKVEICNLALRRIGSSAIIQALTESSQEAYNCNAFYENALLSALESYPWDFAREVVELTALADTLQDDDEYEYVYQIPSGCVRALYILPKQNPAIDFARRKTKLYANVEDAVLAYTDFVDVPAYYPHNFVRALSYAIAVDICLPLTSDAALQQRMVSLFQGALPEAKTVDGKQGKKTIPNYSDIVEARA